VARHKEAGLSVLFGDNQAEELRAMGIHSVYNIFANVGAAYA
jgi:hypothetical protein